MSARRAKNRAEPIDRQSVKGDVPAESAPISIRELPEAPSAPERSLPFLLLLLAGSGCAALIYEIVWFQLLQLVIGSSAVSLGLLLAAYMGGLCLGSAALSRARFRARNIPCASTPVLELGIGAFGIIALFGVPLVGRIYVAGADARHSLECVLRGVVAAVCLLPPTVLMGASFPAIARWVETDAAGSLLAGAALQRQYRGRGNRLRCAGFYLLRVHDMAVATYAAAAINVAVALLAFGARGALRHDARDGAPATFPVRRAPGAVARSMRRSHSPA